MGDWRASKPTSATKSTPKRGAPWCIGRSLLSKPCSGTSDAAVWTGSATPAPSTTLNPAILATCFLPARWLTMVLMPVVVTLQTVHLREMFPADSEHSNTGFSSPLSSTTFWFSLGSLNFEPRSKFSSTAVFFACNSLSTSNLKSVRWRFSNSPQAFLTSTNLTSSTLTGVACWGVASSWGGGGGGRPKSVLCLCCSRPSYWKLPLPGGFLSLRPPQDSL